MPVTNTHTCAHCMTHARQHNHAGHDSNHNYRSVSSQFTFLNMGHGSVMKCSSGHCQTTPCNALFMNVQLGGDEVLATSQNSMSTVHMN